MSVISFLRPHSNRPISSSLFSVISIDPFSLFARSPLLLCLTAFSLYSVFSQIFLFHLTLPCVLKRFPLTIRRKITTTCAENVLTRTPGYTNPDVLTLTPDHAEHDVLPLTPTPEFPSQDKPGRGRGHGGMVAHDLVNGWQATA